MSSSVIGELGGVILFLGAAFTAGDSNTSYLQESNF